MAYSDNEGGKRRSKIGKVKAFEEMLLKDVPGMTCSSSCIFRMTRCVYVNEQKIANNQLNLVLTFRHFNLQVTYM